MKKFFTVLLLGFISVVCTEANDSLKIVNLQREVNNLKSNVLRLQQEDGRLRGLYQQQAKDLDSLRAKQLQQTENVKVLADKVGADILDANQKIDSNVSTLSESINSRSWLGALGILIAIGLLTCTYYILRRKISSGASTIDKIRSAQEGLETAQKAMQEESVKLDSKLVELLDGQIKALPTNVSMERTEQSLVLKVVKEISRMEMNLSRMDSSIKGHKILSKAIERMKDNLTAYGYEVVDLLGKPYNEGLKVVASFVSDETLAKGEQKITKVIIPQVNYNGKVIQVASVEVSENI